MPKKLSKSSTANNSVSSANNSVSSASSDQQRHHPWLPAILSDSLPLPRLIVFDLDYTLWPFWVDTHVNPPIKAAPGSSNTAAVDRTGERFAFYPDVPAILHALPHAGVRLAVASRTCAPDLARDMLKLLYVHPPSPQDLNPAGGGGGGLLAPNSGRDLRGSASTTATSSTTGSSVSTGSAGGSGKKEKPRKALDLFDSGLEIYPGSKIRHLESLGRRTGVGYGEILFFDDESRNRNVESLGVTMRLVPDGIDWAELERGIWEWRRRRGIARGERRGR